VLVEVCNLNNPDDRRLLVSRAYREKVAQAIVSALVEFYGGSQARTITAEKKGASPAGGSNDDRAARTEDD
jgi:hypothetical protein